MAGPLAVPVIGAIGNLLGGLFGRSKQKVISAGDNFQSHIGGLMLAAKEHGFNPLTLLQNGQAIGPTVLNSDNSAFGAGIANAFALAGDAIASKRATAQKLNNYQTQNQRLQSRLDAITLRSPVPGVYGTAKMPADPEVYGDVSVSDPAAMGLAGPELAARGPAGGPFLTALPTSDPVDPRREVVDKPIETHSGVMTIDNPWVGRVRVPTLDGDEPVDILDIPSIAVVAPQMAYKFLNTPAFSDSMNGNFDGVDPDRWMQRKPKKRPYERMGRNGALPLRTRDQRWTW